MNAQTISRLITEDHGFLDVREEFQLVFDVIRRIHRPIGQLADVLGAIDDLEMAVVVEDSRRHRS
jgi:hypothetical protein